MQVLFQIILYCQKDLLSKFLAKDLLQYIDDVDFSMHNAVDILARASLGYADDAQKAMCLQVFLKLFEAGVSVAMIRTLRRPTPTLDENFPAKRGLKLECLTALKILYGTGALSNEVINHLCQAMEAGNIWSDPETKSKPVRDYLQQLSTEPRSLQSYCAVAVSDQIGCRANRKERALALGLPEILTRKVLFLDILYPEEGFPEYFTPMKS